jgi:phage gp46-like protein
MPGFTFTSRRLTQRTAYRAGRDREPFFLKGNPYSEKAIRRHVPASRWAGLEMCLRDNMSGLQIFEGDLLLEETPDGGDIRIENRLFVSDRSLGTAVYLSLLGGNKDDNGKVKSNKTWWGNTLPGVAENEKIISRFQALIYGLPMSTKNIQKAENAALLDLNWIIDEGIADKIISSGRATARNKFSLHVDIRARGKSIYKNAFSLFWRMGIYGSL